jgi:hypothetical protein
MKDAPFEGRFDYGRRTYPECGAQASSMRPRVSGSVGRVKDLVPCRAATSRTSACILNGLKRIGLAPERLIVSTRVSLHSGWSQSITTAASDTPAIASSTDSSFPRNLGCKPRSSTIIPNNAATISSRASISTLPNDANREGTQLVGNLRTFGINWLELRD